MFFRKNTVEVQDIWYTMGLRGTGSDSYTVTDLFVPEAYTMKRDGSAKPRVRGSFMPLPRPPSTPAASPASRWASPAASWPPSFRRPPAPSRGAAAADIWTEARTRGHLTQDELLSIRLASSFAIQSAKQVVASLYEAAGLMAIFNARPFERRFRDIHTVTQQIQGHPEHFETVGQVLLGRKPDRPLFTF